MLLEGQKDVFRANITVSEKLPFLKVGDEIKGQYNKEYEGVNLIIRMQ
ncbi:hypothetical protein AAC978_10260 [Desulfitobacterium sp. THU1]